MKLRFTLAFRLCGVLLIAFGMLTVIHTLIDYPEAYLRTHFNPLGGGYRTLDFSSLIESLAQLIPAFVGTAIYLLSGRLAGAIAPSQAATGAQQTAFVVIRLLVMLVFCFALLELLAKAFDEISLLDVNGQPARMLVEIPLAILRFSILCLFGGALWFLGPRLSRLVSMKLGF